MACPRFPKTRISKWLMNRFRETNQIGRIELEWPLFVLREPQDAVLRTAPKDEVRGVARPTFGRLLGTRSMQCHRYDSNFGKALLDEWLMSASAATHSPV